MRGVDASQLDLKQHELFELGTRWSWLGAFWKELRRQAASQQFEVRNDFAWDAATSLERMLLIDTSEWANGLAHWAKKHLSGHTLDALRASKKKSARFAARSVGGAPAPARPDSILRPEWLVEFDEQRILTGQRTALKAAFGPSAAKRGHALGADVERLQKRLKKFAASLVEHRGVHAHRYLPIPRPKLPLRRQDIPRKLRSYARLLNNIRILIDGTYFAFPPFKASKSHIAEGLVDLILVGAPAWAAEKWKDEPGKYFWQKREAYYKRTRRATRASRG